MTDAWSDFSGNAIDHRRRAVDDRAEGRARRKFLTPEQAVAQMTTVDGLSRSMPGPAEPMITQPMAFCWDDRGRLWVAENRDYESRGQRVLERRRTAAS